MHVPAAAADGSLRISNAVTSGDFGNQLSSPELAVPATEGGDATTFEAKFTPLPVTVQPGLRVTVNPDNGSGGRAGFLSIEHTESGARLVSSGANGNATNWKDIVIAETSTRPRRTSLRYASRRSATGPLRPTTTCSPSVLTVARGPRTRRSRRTTAPWVSRTTRRTPCCSASAAPPSRR